MAARSRDAIFELVVLKEKGDQERPVGEGQSPHHHQSTGASRDGPWDPMTDSPRLEISREHATEQPDGQGEQLEMSGGDGVQVTENGMLESFDNAAYSSTYFSSRDRQATQKTPNKDRRTFNLVSDSKWLFLLILTLLIFVILLALVISGLSLESVNRSELEELQRTSVDNASFQMTNKDVLEMFTALQTQIAELNDSIRALRENLTMVSLELKQTDRTLTERVDSIESETETLTSVALLLSLTLSNQSQRISELQEQQTQSDLRLQSSFNNSLEDVKADIDGLRMQVSMPVDIFGSCESDLRNATLTLSSDDSEMMYVASTESVMATSNVSELSDTSYLLNQSIKVSKVAT